MAENKYNFNVEFEKLGADEFSKKKITPTTLSSSQIEQIEVATRENAFFSSKISDAKLLAEMAEYIGNAAEAKSGFHREDFLRRMRAFLGVSEAQSKRITDITSAQRLRLIYDFHLARISAQKQYLIDRERVEFFPARELLRIENRKEPRDWEERWRIAGGKFFNGRMLAPFDDKIWERISRFGVPYAPFDFNSGMGTRPIPAKQALALGVIKKQEPQQELQAEKAIGDLNAGETQEIPKTPYSRAQETQGKAITRENVYSIGQSAKVAIRRKFGDKIAFKNNKAIFVGEVGEKAAKAYQANANLPSGPRRENISVPALLPENIPFPKGSTNGKRFIDTVADILIYANAPIDDVKLTAFIVSKPEVVKYDKETNKFAFGRKFRDRFAWAVSRTIDAAKKVATFYLLSRF